jgi:hypothetical protein
MTMMKLNIHAVIAGFFLAVVSGQELLAGKKTVVSGGGIAVESSSQAGKAVIAGGAALVMNPSALQTPSAISSMYTSVAPSAVPTLVIGENIVPAQVVAEVGQEILAGKKTVVSGGGIAVESSSQAGKAIIAGGATLVMNPHVLQTVAPSTVPTLVVGENIVPAPSPEVPGETSAATPSAMPSVYPSVQPSVSPAEPSTYPSTGPSAAPTPVIDLNKVPAPSPKVTAEKSAAPRPSGTVGMLLLAMLTWVIVL